MRESSRVEGGGRRLERPIVLYDGCCGLCHWAVRFTLRHERGPWCDFAPLQSERARYLVRQWGRDPEALDTLYVWTGQTLLERSDAALFIARHLRFPWRWLRAWSVVPRFLRDAVYNFIARRRYRWFGRADACWLPSAADRGRFLA